MRFLIITLLTLTLNSCATAQCYPDRHSTNWFDGWASCAPAINPNTLHGAGHWILYDFGAQYAFGQMQIWNTNDPAHLDWGLRDVIIEVSTDGLIWTHVGEYEFAQAPGLPIYEGTEGPDLAGAKGRFLLITAVSNWGGECFGLGELRITAEEDVVSAVADVTANACFEMSAFPNPFFEATNVLITSECPGNLEYAIYDMLGRTVASGTRQGGQASYNLPLNLQDLPQGTYHVRVTQNAVTGYLTLVRMQKS